MFLSLTIKPLAALASLCLIVSKAASLPLFPQGLSYIPLHLFIYSEMNIHLNNICYWEMYNCLDFWGQQWQIGKNRIQSMDRLLKIPLRIKRTTRVAHKFAPNRISLRRDCKIAISSSTSSLNYFEKLLIIDFLKLRIFQTASSITNIPSFLKGLVACKLVMTDLA